jgi:hypothetical protein
MAYQESNYYGDDQHSVNTTGDVVSGDQVAFDQATFEETPDGKYTFAGFHRVQAKVLSVSAKTVPDKDLYALQFPDGKTVNVTAKTLFSNRVYRQPWADEAARSTHRQAELTQRSQSRSQQIAERKARRHEAVSR